MSTEPAISDSFVETFGIAKDSNGKLRIATLGMDFQFTKRAYGFEDTPKVIFSCPVNSGCITASVELNQTHDKLVGSGITIRVLGIGRDAISHEPSEDDLHLKVSLYSDKTLVQCTHHFLPRADKDKSINFGEIYLLHRDFKFRSTDVKFEMEVNAPNDAEITYLTTIANVKITDTRPPPTYYVWDDDEIGGGKDQGTNSLGKRPFHEVDTAADGGGGKEPMVPIKEPNVCVVCMESPVQTRLSPCGHVAMCTICTIKVMESRNNKCPMCRTLIRNHLQVFLT